MGNVNSKNHHFLDPLKRVLDKKFGPAPLLVCVEASNPQTLGRSSNLVMKVIGRENFASNGLDGDQAIRTYFISDRLSVPRLDGHVVVIGGPRSNVIARIGMEYEATLGGKSSHYARHANTAFNLEYAHIDREDYAGRLHADMDMLDEEAREIIHHYYKPLKRFNREDNGQSINLFSKNRYFRWRNGRKLPSVSAEVSQQDGTSGGEKNSYTIYDQYTETVLPNVLSAHWDQHALLIFHGLRALGTYAALLRLGDQRDFLPALEERLEPIVKAWKKNRKKIPSAVQTGWHVVQGLDPKLFPNDTLLKKFIKQRGYKPLEATEDGESIVYRRHHIDGQVPRPIQQKVRRKKVKAIRKDLEKRKFVGRDRRDANPVKLDQINEQRILDAMSLQRDRYSRRHDIYVLGCFEEKKTVYTQQSRALTLVHALYKAGKIKPNTKIAIVGGGVSGMAAAVAAVETGARVVLMEQKPKLAPIQRHCKHRSLNPFSYDWPMAGSERTKTDFPISALNWKASAAAGKVFKRLAKKYKAYATKANRKGDRHVLTTYPNFEVGGYYYDRINRKHIVSQEAFPPELGSVPQRDPSESEDQWETRYSDWLQELAKHNSDKVRNARDAGAQNTKAILAKAKKKFKKAKAKLRKAEASHMGRASKKTLMKLQKAEQKYDLAKQEKKQAKSRAAEAKNYRKKFVDADIVIFATGYGAEDPDGWIETEEIADLAAVKINQSYWKDDSDRFSQCSKDGRTFVVSGSGDGALVDILRLCIKQFDDHKWHDTFLRELGRLTQSEKRGAIWSNRKDILVFAHALNDLFKSDHFKLIEGESERIAKIEETLAGFDIDDFLDAMSIELRDVTVHNVSYDPQPFWAGSALAHRLLVWCLYKKNKVRFIRGSIREAEGKTVGVSRRLLDKPRTFDAEGVVIRHGVAGQNARFLSIPGLLYGTDKDPGEIARDGQRLVSLLRLSNDLHPETEKFFRHTIRNLR